MAVVASIRVGVPWELVYQEDYATRSEAYVRERAIKSERVAHILRAWYVASSVGLAHPVSKFSSLIISQLL